MSCWGSPRLRRVEQMRLCELPGNFEFGKVKSRKYPQESDERLKQVKGRQANGRQTWKSFDGLKF